jgi:gas vesicle protein
MTSNYPPSDYPASTYSAGGTAATDYPADTDPDAIRADIERTRAELSYNVDALTDTANPKNIAGRQVDKVKGAVQGVKERIMGADDDPYDEGAVGDAKLAVQDRVAGIQDRASGLGDAVASAPRRAKQKTQGNPLAAGVIAFGVGLLISGLIPSSQKEQRAISDLQENLEPLKEKAAEVGREMADNLREPAQQAVESVKATATQGAENVKAEGQSAKEQVQDQVQDSKETVQRERSS